MELFKPTIAAVHGPCIGYGLTGVLFCDFVIASTEAMFSFPEVSIGVPTIVGAIRLPQRVGWANAMELLLTGKPMSAERAKEIGLVWKLVEPDELQAEAWAWARTLTEAAPLAQRATKEVAWRTADMGWIESVRFGETMRKVAGATEDAAEGLSGMAREAQARLAGPLTCLRSRRVIRRAARLRADRKSASTRSGNCRIPLGAGGNARWT